MTQPSLFDSKVDPCESHHGGNPESTAAFQKLMDKLPALRIKVLLAVHHLQRATVKDIVDFTNLERLTVGARLTELKQDGMLYKTNEKRDGCGVLALSSYGERVIRDGAL